ncbi:HNH endonuclease [Amycolatopsis sp. NPDC059021]|uniref:HNH endonuclease n=1 Tax=Amycolatopsis sp. NPDC059021 TaxID=3346704 RepID=UPI003672EBEF
MPTDGPGKRNPAWTWDECVLACALVVNNDWRWLDAGDTRVKELSTLLQQLPIHSPESRSEKFRNPNGVARKTADLATIHPAYRGKATRGGRTDKLVVDAYVADPAGMLKTAAALRSSIQLPSGPAHLNPLDLDLDLEGISATEGQVLERIHLVRERDPKLRKRKIKLARKQHGHVACEVCGFDFEEVYGPRGRDYIECHHRTPLSESGPIVTDLSNLALLCSNCHRMIHCRHPWLTVPELQKLVDG